MVDACLQSRAKSKIAIKQIDGCLAWVDIRSLVYKNVMHLRIDSVY